MTSDGPQEKSPGPLSRLPWKAPSPAPRQEGAGKRLVRFVTHLPRYALRVPIWIYRYSLSAFMGRQCRYLPTCSQYADEAIAWHGAWPGLFMATARICRCNPWGGHGYDPVPQCLPAQARWYMPWRYGIWRMPRQEHADEMTRCEGEGADIACPQDRTDVSRPAGRDGEIRAWR